MLYFVDWSARTIPKIALFHVWLTRAAFIMAGAVQAGLKQPDSQLKTHLVWCLYVGGIFLPSYTEYLGCSFIITYTEFIALVVFSGACPLDSSRPCTNYEILLQFNHHTVYLGIAAWIHYHTHSDRRREFARSTIRKRAESTKSRSLLAATDPIRAAAKEAAVEAALASDAARRRRPPPLAASAITSAAAQPGGDSPSSPALSAQDETTAHGGVGEDAAAAAAASPRGWAAAGLPWQEAATVMIVCLPVSSGGWGGCGR